MMVGQAITVSLEALFSQVLKHSTNSLALLQPLDGCICVIHLQELDSAFSLHFSSTEVTVLTSQVYSEQALENLAHNECYVSLALSALSELKQTSHITRLIKQGKFDFYGELTILQNMSHLVSALDLDMEEVIAYYCGDAPAYWISESVKKLNATALTMWQRQSQAMAEFILDEKPIAVRAILLTNFADDVRQLHTDTERFDARLKLLEQEFTS